MGMYLLYLLSHGSSIDEMDSNKFTALHHASKKGNLEIVKLLLSRGSSVDQKNRLGYTSLIIASQEGHLDVVECLLSHGSNANENTNSGGTSLLYATKMSNFEMVQLLVTHVSAEQMSKKDDYGWTSLLYAAFVGHLEIIRCLLDNGSSLNENDNNGWTSLHYVASIGKKMAILHFLVESGCPINKPDNEGKTSLYYAAKNGHIEMVYFLLDAGALEKDDCSMILKNSPSIEVLELLVHEGCTTDEIKSFSSENQFIHFMTEMKQKKTNKRAAHYPCSLYIAKMNYNGSRNYITVRAESIKNWS